MKVKWQKPETESMRRKRERLSERSTYGATCSHPKERRDDKVMRVERPMIVGGDRKRVGIAVAAGWRCASTSIVQLSPLSTIKDQH